MNNLNIEHWKINTKQILIFKRQPETPGIGKTPTV